MDETMDEMFEEVLAICLDRLSDGDSVDVVVSDTGHGLPADHELKLFKAFFTTKAEGLGLGLSIARSIAEAHQGRIWAEKNAGGGATFHFSLPMRSGRRARPR